MNKLSQEDKILFKAFLNGTFAVLFNVIYIILFWVASGHILNLSITAETYRDTYIVWMTSVWIVGGVSLVLTIVYFEKELDKAARDISSLRIKARA